MVGRSQSSGQHLRYVLHFIDIILLGFTAIVSQALHYKKYSTASDVWSYGVLMYEIWSVGHKPFEDYGNSKVSSDRYTV